MLKVNVFCRKRRDVGLLVLRAASAGFLFAHSAHKLVHFQQLRQMFPNPLGVGSAETLIIAILAEGPCMLFVLLGWHTRWFLVPPILTMASALFFVHLAHPWPDQERASLHLAVLIAMFCIGPGRFAMDQKRKRSSDRMS